MHMGVPGRLEQAQAVIAGLFGSRTAVAVTDPSRPQPPLLPGEGDHLTRALPSRQTEFAAGRAAARAAMRALGHPARAILAAEDRSPIWPVGLSGTISHSRSLCAAAVTDAPQYLGLDLEPDTDLDRKLLHTICSEAEATRIAGPDHLRLAKLVFSAKEAGYKAQYPASGALFGFDHLDIRLDLPAHGFTATFLKDAGSFRTGDKMQGRFARVAGHIVTAVTIPQGGRKGG